MKHILKTWTGDVHDITLGKTYEFSGNAAHGFRFKDNRGYSRNTAHGSWKVVPLCKEVKGVQPSNTFLDDIAQNTKELAKADTIEVRNKNVGNSNYATYKIQPWDVWLEYDLNPWDADIVKRVLRKKHDATMSPDEHRVLDYNKIIHICQERIRQLEK